MSSVGSFQSRSTRPTSQSTFRHRRPMTRSATLTCNWIGVVGDPHCRRSPTVSGRSPSSPCNCWLVDRLAYSPSTSPRSICTRVGRRTSGGSSRPRPGQRLVATHAPAVLARFNPTQAVAVTAGAARQLLGAAFVGESKQYHHWWVESALEPLTADRIVFVEGISDRIIVCAVAELLGHQLDRCGASVVALNGAGTSGRRSGCSGLAGSGSDCSGWWTRTRKRSPADALGVAVAELASNDVLTCHADLEAECATSLGVVDTISLRTNSGLFTERAILRSAGAA